MHSYSLILLLTYDFIRGSSSRSYKDTLGYKYYTYPIDPMRALVSQEIDPLRFTDAPTAFPTPKPSSYPTETPSVSPSFTPTNIPSNVPSNRPSNFPTTLPSTLPSVRPSTHRPTITPSSRPTTSPTWSYKAGVVPLLSSPEAIGYFNYDPLDTRYGPGQAVALPYSYNYTYQINMTSSNSSDGSVWNTTMNITEARNYTYLNYNASAWPKNQNSLEFQYWKNNINKDMQRNMVNKCASVPDARQSPIDLCETHLNSECEEHHQIRNRAGEYKLHSSDVKIQLLPSKFRIEYSRANGALDPTLPRPPNSDFPLNWNGYFSVIHIDVKIPSEHTICGKRYAGEYQVYYYHPLRKMPVVQSVLIDIHPRNWANDHFQLVINEWQAIFDMRKAKCWAKKSRLMKEEEKLVTRMKNFVRSGRDDDALTLWDEEKTEEKGSVTSTIFINSQHQSNLIDEPEDEELRRMDTVAQAEKRARVPLFQKDYHGIDYMIGRASSHIKDATSKNLRDRRDVLERIQTSALMNSAASNVTMPSVFPSQSPSTAPSSGSVWNPLSPKIIRSIYFYGYSGSLTEPPCSEWVAWRVLDTPMEISSQQLDQMKNILFNQVDEDCRRTSVHYDGSVARPIQSLNDRPLWKCTPTDYVSDWLKEKIREETGNPDWCC